MNVNALRSHLMLCMSEGLKPFYNHSAILDVYAFSSLVLYCQNAFESHAFRCSRTTFTNQALLLMFRHINSIRVDDPTFVVSDYDPLDYLARTLGIDIGDLLLIATERAPEMSDDHFKLVVRNFKEDVKNFIISSINYSILKDDAVDLLDKLYS